MNPEQIKLAIGAVSVVFAAGGYYAARLINEKNSKRDLKNIADMNRNQAKIEVHHHRSYLADRLRRLEPGPGFIEERESVARRIEED
jgi:hypothetical protein